MKGNLMEKIMEKSKNCRNCRQKDKMSTDLLMSIIVMILKGGDDSMIAKVKAILLSKAKEEKEEKQKEKEKPKLRLVV